MTRGLNTIPDNICVTRGSQMALYVIAQSIIAKDDTVIFEELTYPPAVQAFTLAGAKVQAAKLGPEGIDLNHLESICRRTRVRAVYLTPGHQFPTTLVLRPSARLRLRALAAQFGFIVVEDDYDHEFQFDHQPMFPLASNDHAGQIIYVGSFSKVLSPSLRVGYVAGSSRLIAEIGNWIGAIDRQGDPITELAIVELIESGQLRRHIKRVHAVFDKRRTAFARRVARRTRRLCQFRYADRRPGILAAFAGRFRHCEIGAALAWGGPAIPDEHAMRDRRQAKARRPPRLRQPRRAGNAGDGGEAKGGGGRKVAAFSGYFASGLFAAASLAFNAAFFARATAGPT